MHCQLEERAAKTSLTLTLRFRPVYRLLKHMLMKRSSLTLFQFACAVCSMHTLDPILILQ